MPEREKPTWRRELGQLSLSCQLVLFVVCVYVGHKLTVASGPWVANVLGVEYESGQQTMIGLFFVTVVAMAGIIGYRAIRSVWARRHREKAQ